MDRDNWAILICAIVIIVCLIGVGFLIKNEINQDKIRQQSFIFPSFYCSQCFMEGKQTPAVTVYYGGGYCEKHFQETVWDTYKSYGYSFHPSFEKRRAEKYIIKEFGKLPEIKK